MWEGGSDKGEGLLFALTYKLVSFVCFSLAVPAMQATWIFVTLFGKTRLNENNVELHFNEF